MKHIIKNIFNLLLITVVFTFFTGCDEDYLAEDYRDGLSPQTFYNNDTEAQMAVNGVYVLIKGSGYFGGRWRQAAWNFGADEMGPSRNIWKEVHNYTFAEGVYDGQRIWDSAYSVIRNANSVIQGVKDNDKLSDAIKKQTHGEALVLRAIAYYDLTVQFGDVPYFRELLSSEELSKLPRISLTKIRTEMKDDLQEAFNLLPDSYSGADLGRMTKWAAIALKSKFHLMDSEWADVLSTSENIINNSPHKLMDKFEDVYGWDKTTPGNQVKTEHILWIDYAGALGSGLVPRHNLQLTNEVNPRLRDEPKDKKQRNALKKVLAANNHAFTGFGAQVPLPDLANKTKWESGDLRYDATILNEYGGFKLKFSYFKKLQNLDQIHSMRNGHAENVVMIRLADIYLMAAEAANELSGPSSAYKFVNKVRERAFEPDKPWTGMTKESFRTALQEERKFELCAEGHRRVDLIRWGILLETVEKTKYFKYSTTKTNIKPKHVKYPIPLDEILRNPVLLESDPTNNGYR